MAGSSITISNNNVVIPSDEEALAEWKKAEFAVAVLGDEYVIFGARKVIAADLSDIRKQIDYYERKILAKKGASGRNIADFGNRGLTGDVTIID